MRTGCPGSGTGYEGQGSGADNLRTRNIRYINVICLFLTLNRFFVKVTFHLCFEIRILK